MAYRHGSSRHNGTADTLARGLGWFSIALGMTELLAADSLTRWLGMEHRTGLVRAYGLREVATGIGILASDDPTPWIWGRVAGDALDIVTLAAGFAGRNPEGVGMALGTVAAVTALDVVCATQLGASTPRQPVRDYSDRSGLPRPPDEMRGAARDFQAPRDMRTPEAMRPLH